MKYKILFIAIIFLAFGLRVYGINWDQNQHLHPDERFLTMVGTGLKMPTTLSDYLNPQISTMNPYNQGSGFFVYGSFPLYVTKGLALLFTFDTYNQFAILGRFLSALFDTGTIIITYFLGVLISTKLHKRKTSSNRDFLFGFLAAAFLSFNVLAIQQSHFFTVDAFLTFFITTAVFTFLKGFYSDINRSAIYFLFTAILFGLAIASKIIGLFFLPFFLLFFLLYRLMNKKITKQTLLETVIIFSSFMVASYCTFRFIQPFYFANNNFLNPHLNPETIANFKQLSAIDNSLSTFPPSVQWQSKQSIIWPLTQMFLYGLNPIVSLLSISGLVTIIFYFWRVGRAVFIKKRYSIFSNFIQQYAGLLFLSFYSLAFFIYQGSRFTMNMRYFYMTYPMLIILAVFALFHIVTNKFAMRFLVALAFIVSIVWSLAFVSIYGRSPSRVVASNWIYENILPGSKLAIEHWDDGLPLSLPNQSSSIYSFVEIPVYDEETTQKWDTFRNRLSESDYYILSSNRAWGSIPLHKKRYPKTAIFYQKLFSEEMGLSKVAEFTSRPRIGFLEVNDDNAEENFTVFDHPKVIIFKIIDKEKLVQTINNLKN